MTFHRLIRNASPPRQHSGFEIGGDLLDIGLDQLTLLFGKRDAWRAHGLELASSKHLHLEPLVAELFGAIDKWQENPDGPDPGAWRSVNGIGLRGDPVRSTAHLPRAERIDGLAFRGISHSLPQLRRSVHGAARRIDVQEQGIHVIPFDRLTDGGRHLVHIRGSK